MNQQLLQRLKTKNGGNGKIPAVFIIILIYVIIRRFLINDSLLDTYLTNLIFVAIIRQKKFISV